MARNELTVGLWALVHRLHRSSLGRRDWESEHLEIREPVREDRRGLNWITPGIAFGPPIRSRRYVQVCALSDRPSACG